MYTPEFKNRILNPIEAQIHVAKQYLSGLKTPSEDTPPWVLQILRFHSEKEITPQLIEEVIRSGGTDHPDPYFT